ncbi:rab-GTPase-TBC domain-containing protein [Delphinella strobiligena]|nr:rab-GTPase-TBC domain-containing protein [Delphinella strobiligena]
MAPVAVDLADETSPYPPTSTSNIDATPSTPPRTKVPTFRFTADEVKRDSAIAQTCSPTNCQPQSPSTGAKSISSPPSVAGNAAPPKSTKINTSFLRRFSKDREQTESEHTSSPEQASSVPGHRKLKSFHGIDLDLSSDSGLDDLAPEKINFSNRGSVLLDGKKPSAMTGGSDGTMPSTELETVQASPPIPDPNTPTNGIGLQTGRRTPSVHMLQAVMHGTRVLSAEEVTFSERVRTMYEHGDENAADWTRGSPVALSPSPMPESSDGQDGTPEADVSDLSNYKPVRRPQTSRPHAESRMSFIAREEGETAGGIEYWNEIPEGAVDRYGFIKPGRVTSQTSTGGLSLQIPEVRPGMQRVSTSLQLLSNSPRQTRRGLFRRPSTATTRYSRSLPPSRASTRLTTQSVAPSASIYSFQSNHSTARVQNPFRLRERRLLEEASDMLTLPPGLSNIDEMTSTSQDIIKRREWSRDEKWHRMARLIPCNKTGGGMQFDFDVNDPKLQSRTWKGVPDRWRATAWHSFLSASARKRGNFPSDETLVRMFVDYQDQSSADDVQIDVDVPRTISMHVMFRRRYRGGQRLLFRVLHAISLHFPTTGYVQGMAALAATLLCYYDEEMAFAMLVRMWQLRGLEELYASGFEGLMAALDEFHTQWLSNDADMSEKLQELGIEPTSYGTRWYLTLFNMSIPFPAQLRVWDVFMLLGDACSPDGGPPQPNKFGGADLAVLHAASSALVEAMRTVLMESDFENGMKVLTSWIPVQDEDTLMRVARAEWKIGMRNRKRDARTTS